MVAEPFDMILQELGAALEIPNLQLDDKNTCLVKFKNGLSIFFEPSQNSEEFLILTELATLSPGAYRQDVLRETLKANGYPYPRYGTFAFCDNSQKLVLFELMPLKDLRGEAIASFLTPFMERALAWKAILDRNEIPVASTLTHAKSGTTRSKGMFGGLIP